MARQIKEYYTWSHPYGEYAYAHTDGASSVAIVWDGVDSEMMSTHERAAEWAQLHTLIRSIPVGYCPEFHWWREYDSTLADEYLEKGNEFVRGQEFAMPLRVAMANHLAPYGMLNQVALVLTKLPPHASGIGAKRKLVKQGINAEELLVEAGTLVKRLAGARLLTADEYADLIVQSYDRARYESRAKTRLHSRFLINEQLLREAPRRKGRYVSVGGRLTKVLLVHMYPDAAPAWSFFLSSLQIPMHIVHVLIPIDTRKSIRDSERASDFEEGTAGRAGRTLKGKVMMDLAEFRQYVADKNLDIFKNAYIIHLHGTEPELEETEREIADWLRKSDGEIKDSEYMQVPYFRAGQPGQGYRCQVFRPDESEQVANMLPVQVYKTGARRPESLRVTTASALVGFSPREQKVCHTFTVAMTGGGKGVEKVAQIVESYPFGTDWYIAEIGGSYRWVVEAFGGKYSRIDPNEHVVNPLPPFSVVSATDELPLNATLAGGTINALSFLLTDGKTELNVHQLAAGQGALQRLYKQVSGRDGMDAPLLPDYLVELEKYAKDVESDPQRIAALEMSQNLHSFLDTTEGRVFARPDNLVLSEGITGVDLKDVDKANPKLLKFYLVFLALRFTHLAFARRTLAMVLLDEMHKFVKVAPEVTGKLISEIARMGRKDAGGIDIVTQGIAEIDVIEKEVLNSMPMRNLLYRPDGWDEIAGRISMPDGALQIWKGYPNPLQLDWRPCMKSVGDDWYDLHLTFPTALLDLAATGPDDLDLKERIGERVKDPFERLKLFRKTKEGMAR